MATTTRPAYRDPAHHHMLEEEHLLLLEGSGTSRLGYLIIGERNPSDVIVYADSSRVGVRLTGEGYRKSATMDDWVGEDTGAP